ncbi:hypothetical protein [Aggregatilinea lenta]|uniref:hypothetical protein n=1 Tax=Aggregatilinea lenta TaxID=913108 RepID=UPI000E5A64DB|nr:hypothetical protein [Aggregatilinea lenta]
MHEPSPVEVDLIVNVGLLAGIAYLEHKLGDRFTLYDDSTLEAVARISNFTILHNIPFVAAACEMWTSWALIQRGQDILAAIDIWTDLERNKITRSIYAANGRNYAFHAYR